MVSRTLQIGQINTACTSDQPTRLACPNTLGEKCSRTREWASHGNCLTTPSIVKASQAIGLAAVEIERIIASLAFWRGRLHPFISHLFNNCDRECQAPLVYWLIAVGNLPHGFIAW